MRIGIDARLYGPKHKGIGRYIQQLIKYLEKIDQRNHYFICLNRENLARYQPVNPNFETVQVDYPPYSFAEQLFFPGKLMKYNLDLVHFPHFNVPLFYRGRFVATVHDLTMHQNSPRSSRHNFLLFYLKKFIYRLVINHALKRAKKIIVSSRATKKDILSHYSLPPEKIEVIYEAA